MSEAKQGHAIQLSKLPSVSESMARRAEHHGAIEEVVPGHVYAVQGSFPLELGLPTKLGITKIARTMTIVRDGTELTLINGIHLTPRGYAQLDGLGKVKKVVRLGSFHGVDDANLLSRYRAEYWIVDGMDVHDGLSELGIEVKTMRLGGELPIEGANLLLPPAAHLPEGLLVLPHGNGVLVSVDSLMNNPDKMCYCGGHTSLMMQPAMRKRGLTGTGRAPGPWLDANYKVWGKEPRTILPAFYRGELIPARWDTFVSAHGPPLVGQAKPKVKATLEKQFSVKL